METNTTNTVTKTEHQNAIAQWEIAREWYNHCLAELQIAQERFHEKSNRLSEIESRDQ